MFCFPFNDVLSIVDLITITDSKIKQERKIVNWGGVNNVKRKVNLWKLSLARMNSMRMITKSYGHHNSN